MKYKIEYWKEGQPSKTVHVSFLNELNMVVFFLRENGYHRDNVRISKAAYQPIADSLHLLIWDKGL